MQCKNRKCGAELPEGAVFCPKCGRKQQAGQQRTKARGNGQGTAVKRGNTWSAVWSDGSYIGDDDKLHRRRHWKGGFSSRSAALAYSANPPEAAPAPAPTLRSYWTGWRDSAMLDLSAKKQSSYKTAWKKMASLADKRMDALTINDLQACIDAKTDTYYPARDIKTVLSHCYKRAVAEGNARTNLSEFIRLPPLDEKEMTPFSEAELYRLWQVYGEGDSFIGFVLLMIYSGMMPGELLQCKKDMILWDEHEIRGCGLKTKKRKATPIVYPEMVEPVVRDIVEKSGSRAGYVVGMNRDKWYVQYHEALQRAGVRDLPPYSCRHTTATALALGNIAPSVIQAVMRHTKFSSTQRYIHPDTASAHAAINTMDKGSATENANHDANHDST